MGLVSQAMVRIVGDDSHVAATLKRVNASMEATEKKFDNDFGRIAQSVQRGALALAAFGAAAVYTGAKAVKSAAEAEAIWRRLDGSLANVGINFGSVRGEIETTANQLQKFTRYGDEETASVLQRLVVTTGDYRRSLQNVELVMDVAIGTQMDLDAAARLVGKGMVGVTSEFKRYGIVLKEGEEATDALRRKFGGLAREDGKTMEAQMQRISNAVDNVFEAFGNAIAGDNATASIGGVADAIQALADTIERNEEGIHTFFSTIGGTFRAMGGGLGALARGENPVTAFLMDAGRRSVTEDPRLIAARNLQGWGKGGAGGGGGSGIPGAPTLRLDPFNIEAPSQLELYNRFADYGTAYNKRFFAGTGGQMGAGQSTEEFLASILAGRDEMNLRTRMDMRNSMTGGSTREGISASQWMGAASSGAQLLAGLAQGRTSALGGISGAAGIAGGLVGGPAGIALQGVSIATSLVEGLFGGKNEQEDRMRRAHLAALREARREQQTVIQVNIPRGSRIDRAELIENLVDIQGSNAGDYQWRMVEVD